jgi:hypothetical protein
VQLLDVLGCGGRHLINRASLALDVVSRNWVAFDLVAVLVFVVIGRSVHDHGVDAAGIGSTVWPFAIGVLVGWLVVALLDRTGATLVDGALVVIVTVGVGMPLRFIAGQGVVVAFVFVALGFIGLFMLGGRAAFAALQHVRSKRSSL